MPEDNKWQVALNGLLEVLKHESIAYLEGHQEDVSVLGKDTVKAILAQEMISKIPIPEISSSLTEEQIRSIDAIIMRRDQIFQLVSKAELENSQRIAKLRMDAIGVAGKIGQFLLSTGLGIIVQSL